MKEADGLLAIALSVWLVWSVLFWHMRHIRTSLERIATEMERLGRKSGDSNSTGGEK